MHYDQSFNFDTLLKVLRKSDFYHDRNLHIESYKISTIESAIVSAHAEFHGTNPLRSFHLNNKTIYRFQNLRDELVVRKVCQNLKRVFRDKQQSRDLIISNLSHLLSEGVPYRLYRLDVKSFYESFSSDAVVEKLESLPGLSPLSKNILQTLMSHYLASGGSGVPRGLALSAVLSDLMMADFDTKLSRLPNVYFNARYVDDIMIITNADECQRAFIKMLKNLLPTRLVFSETKKEILTLNNRVTPNNAPIKLIEFSYLGYKFSVSEPIRKRDTRPGQFFRDVSIDIAPTKVRRFKTRIVRSFVAYSKDRDFPLLSSRLQYLTSNFSVKDLNKNNYKLAGIYHSYPQITLSTATGLKELDNFLRDAILSRTGRVFRASSFTLTTRQRRELLKRSFSHGHEKKTFIHFHPRDIRKIEECWVHG